MEVDLFDFELPESLIAQTPLKERTESRLLVLHKNTGRMEHRRFSHFIEYLHPGDVLVLNNTRVIPARLFGVKKDTGAKAELLLLRNLGEDRWETLARPAKRIRKGAELWFGPVFGDGEERGWAPELKATVEEEKEMGMRVVRFHYRGIFQEILDRLGQMPLPPYIREQLDDKERYQTVYAKESGSVAAPTAGLHFTEEYLRRIEEKGVDIRYVTLHVGLGTFRPVSVTQVEEHRMHEEFYIFPQETADAIRDAKQNGNRVIAVGTTSVRTLETAARRCGDGPLQASSGWTDLFIYPGFRFRLVDAMLTNFHLPRSTLLMMISAFAGRERVLDAYQEAIRHRYRFFSFGDAMLIADE